MRTIEAYRLIDSVMQNSAGHTYKITDADYMDRRSFATVNVKITENGDIIEGDSNGWRMTNRGGKTMTEKMMHNIREMQDGAEIPISPIGNEGEEWEERLRRRCAEVADGDVCTAPDGTETLDGLLEMYLGWADEINGKKLPEKSGTDRFSAWLRWEYALRYGRH